MNRTLITHARIVDPASSRDDIGDLLFDHDGAILDVAPRIEAEANVIDATGLALLPGLIDMRVVIGEPGAEHKETFKSAGRAAVAGGITTMVMQPNADPVIDDASLVDYVLRRANDRSPARILPAAALTKGLKGELMSEIGLLTEAGAVLFSNGDAPIVDSRVMRRALAYSTAFGALVSHRPEDPFLARNTVMNEGELAMRLGLPGNPPAAERIYAERDLALAELTGGRLLLDMISSAETLDCLRRAKTKGVEVYASISVHHAALNQHAVMEGEGGYRTFAKLSPPLRREEDRVALCEAVASGLIDVIVSGHDPRPAEDKRLPFEEAAFGAAALETLLPGALSLYHNGAASLMDVVRAMTLRPAEILGLKQGRLQKGAPADLILVDLDKPVRIEAEKLRSKSRNSPFDGRLLQGETQRTFVSGKQVFGGS
ncbi:MAG: amidohydrolase family protein [Alphaproteobacteria bacterium]|nr:amidohydrolase family protein [Alphaproteobacteria bacterium]